MSTKRWGALLIAWLFVFTGTFFITGCSTSSDDAEDAITSAVTDLTTDVTVDQSDGTGFTNTDTTDGTGTALEVADKVSVVDAKLSSSLTKPLGLDFDAIREAVADLPADSAYNTDEQFVWVSDRSTEAFGLVNEILCMMGQSKYADMVNKGAYIAQIDNSECSKDRDDASSNSDSSSDSSSQAGSEGGGVDYAMWTVISSRVDTATPHIVRVWIHEKNKDPMYEWEQTILVRAIITQAASASNPIGLFTLYFQGFMGADTSGSEMMRGYLRSKIVDNVTLLQLVDRGTMDFNEDDVIDDQWTESVTLNKTGETSGGGSISTSKTRGQETPETTAFNIAYTDGYFYRGYDNSNLCFDRNDPDYSSWRYNLYTADTGARLARSSGFPITFTVNNVKKHGYVSYWGLWTDGNETLAHDTTVTREVYNGTGDDYKVFIGNGKLMKYTRDTTPLGDLQGVPLEFGMADGQNWIQVRAEWDSTRKKFMKTGTRTPGQRNWTEVTPATVMDLSSMWDLHFWSQALGGNGRIVVRHNTTGAYTAPTNTTDVVFHTEQVVYPGAAGVPATFACFDRCPDPSAMETSSPFYANSLWEGGEVTMESLARDDTGSGVAPGVMVEDTHYRAYSFDSAMYAMTGGSSGTGDEIKQDTTPSGDNQWGVHTGPMIDVATAMDGTTLKCPGTSFTCASKVRELATYYRWMTGEDSWNRFTALKEPVGVDTNGNGTAGEFVAFDPPLPVEYTHTWADASKSKFFLEYGGEGDLWGIPGMCVNHDTGAEVDCGSGEFARWIPQFSISDGSAVTDSSDGTTQYYVKALEKEERMKPVDEEKCSAVMTLTSYTLPVLSDWIAPGIGTEPTVTDAPAVIGGVLQ